MSDNDDKKKDFHFIFRFLQESPKSPSCRRSAARWTVLSGTTNVPVILGGPSPVKIPVVW